MYIYIYAAAAALALSRVCIDGRPDPPGGLFQLMALPQGLSPPRGCLRDVISTRSCVQPLGLRGSSPPFPPPRSNCPAPVLPSVVSRLRKLPSVKDVAQVLPGCLSQGGINFRQRKQKRGLEIWRRGSPDRRPPGTDWPFVLSLDSPLPKQAAFMVERFKLLLSEAPPRPGLFLVYKGPRVQGAGVARSIQTFSVWNGATRLHMTNETHQGFGRCCLKTLACRACGAGELHSMRKLLRVKPAARGVGAGAAGIAAAATQIVYCPPPDLSPITASVSSVLQEALVKHGVESGNGEG